MAAVAFLGLVEMEGGLPNSVVAELAVAAAVLLLSEQTRAPELVATVATPPTSLTPEVLAAVAVAVALDVLAMPATVATAAVAVAVAAVCSFLGLAPTLVKVDLEVVCILDKQEHPECALFVILRRMNYDLQSLQ